jgi:hypothetical protein
MPTPTKYITSSSLNAETTGFIPIRSKLLLGSPFPSHPLQSTGKARGELSLLKSTLGTKRPSVVFRAHDLAMESNRAPGPSSDVDEEKVFLGSR